MTGSRPHSRSLSRFPCTGAQATAEPIKLTDKEIAAQCTVFFLAGFETSSSTIMFTLYLLAKNLHVQEKTVEDIRNSLNRHGGKISYEMLADVPYLDMVINGQYPAGEQRGPSYLLND